MVVPPQVPSGLTVSPEGVGVGLGVEDDDDETVAGQVPNSGWQPAPQWAASLPQ